MQDLTTMSWLRNASTTPNGTIQPFMFRDNVPTNITDDVADNHTNPIDNPENNKLIQNLYVQTVFYIFYIIIFVVGVIGNMLVCYVVFRNKAMHTVTNFFITNLALSDILLCVLAVPFTPLYTFLERWIFGVAMCHMVPYAQGVSIYISTLTLTSIAMDRYIVIIYPFRHRMRLSICVFIITAIWSVSLLLTLPYGLYVRLNPDAIFESWYCEEDWPSETKRKLFGTITVTLQFVLPFLIISMCYILVSYKLNDRARSKPGSKTAKKEEADRDRKKRTNRMLISMVAVFGISWLPMNAMNILNDYYEMKSDYYTVLFFITHCIAMSSTCYNPFLYAWLNENFRKEFKQVLPFFRHARYNGVGIYSRAYGIDRKLSQQCGGEPSTRASEIIPRGPTCNFSIKNKSTKNSDNDCFAMDADENRGQPKLLPPPVKMMQAAVTIDCSVTATQCGGSGGGGAQSFSTTVLPTGLLETQFDAVESVTAVLTE